MLAHSEYWDYAIRRGAQRVSYVDVYWPPSSITPSMQNVPLKAFNIRVDRNSDIRRTGTIEISDPELLDRMRSVSSPSSLEPYGAEFYLRHGVIHNDGTEELMPIGRFHTEDVKYTNPGAEAVLNVVDRSKIFKRKLYGFPRDAGGGLSQGVFLHPLQTMTPYVTLDIDPDVPNYTIPGGTMHRGDMLTIMHQTAASLGSEFYFDPTGVARVVLAPRLDVKTYAGVPDWEVDTGEEGVLVKENVNLSRADTYNRVLVIGVPPGENQAAVYADIQDNDPRSRTHYYGPFGQVDKWIDDNTLTTQDHCMFRARMELAKSMGLSKKVELETLGNPALEEGDIIRVTNLDGLREYHLIEGFSIDHTGKMSLDTKTEQASTGGYY